MPQNPSDGLILPPGTRPPKAIPQCPACEQEFVAGQVVVYFIGEVAPGALKLAPIHLGCALQAAQAVAQEDLGEED